MAAKELTRPGLSTTNDLSATTPPSFVPLTMDSFPACVIMVWNRRQSENRSDGNINNTNILRTSVCDSPAALLPSLKLCGGIEGRKKGQ